MTTGTERRSTRSPFLADVRQRLLLIAITLATVGLFSSCLFGSGRLAFRDVGHFYLPLYGYLGERFANEGLPLWNPSDRFGIPVAGEATTAIFYPPRLLFSCGLPADYAMTLYVLGHLVLAGAGAHWAARRSGANAVASLAAAICYPASGSVFFLYTNPPFLVGAAWLPWILASLLAAIHHPLSSSTTARRGFLASIAGGSIALAMAVLGGDPQTAFHAVLFVAAYWFWLRLRRGRSRRRAAVPPRLTPPCPRLAPLLACVLIALGLSSLQIFAGLAWSLQSWRQQTQPPNVYRWIASGINAEAPVLDPPARAATAPHASSVYDYSVAPWHWCELASPWLSGPLFPENGRLSMLIPGEPRMWTPTLYAGLLPLICLFAGPLRPKQWTVWHAMVAVGLLMALGEFGVGKMLRVGLGVFGVTLPGRLHDSVGGGYWALVTFFPGYGQFRYPAKWLPFAALGMAVWMAVFLTRCDARNRRRALRIAGGLVIAGILLLVAAWLPLFERSVAEAALAANHSDPFWGPLNVPAGLRSLRLSLLTTILVAGAYASLFGEWRWWQRNASRSPRQEPPLAPVPIAREPMISGGGKQSLAVLILLGDLIVSTSWQLAVVDRASSDRSDSVALRDVSDPHSPSPLVRVLSLAAPDAWPPAWRKSGAADRLERVEAAQRETWFGRWHLSDSVAVVNSSVSIGSARSELFWNESRRYADALASGDRLDFLVSLSRFLAVEALAERRTAASGGGPDAVDLRLRPVQETLPIIRWHGDWEFSGESDFHSLAARMQKLSAAIDHSGGDPVPQVEQIASPTVVQPERPDGNGGTNATGSIELVRWQPERIRLRVDADAGGLVTVQQLQDGAWRARMRRESESRWTGVPVHRVDGIAQGAFIPAGRHEVEFRYRPIWLTVGTLTTAATILILLYGCWWQWHLSRE